MFGLSSGSAIIDFCIGMMFFFLIMTLSCTMINEYIIARWKNLRQKTLLEAISGLFYDVPTVLALYDHPLIRGLYRDDQRPKVSDPNKLILGPGNDLLEKCKEPFKGLENKLPSYIPSRAFATALLDIIAPAKDTTKAQTLDNIRDKVRNLSNSRIRDVLLPLLDAADGNLEKASKNIEKWFDDTMDRVSGWFKSQARWWLLLVAFFVCLILNADSIMVGKMLWQDKELRATVATQAEIYAKKAAEAATTTGQKQNLDQLQKEIQGQIDKLKLPLGWVWPKKPTAQGTIPISLTIADPRTLPTDGCSILLKFLGILLTTWAISLGAPFWTNLLNKFVNLRRNGNVPLKAEEEKK